MLSYQAIGFSQRGQRERGRTTDWLAGSRTMQTLRKLPTISPSTPATMHDEGFIRHAAPRRGGFRPPPPRSATRPRSGAGWPAAARPRPSSAGRTPAPSLPSTSATGAVRRWPTGRLAGAVGDPERAARPLQPAEALLIGARRRRQSEERPHRPAEHFRVGQFGGALERDEAAGAESERGPRDGPHVAGVLHGVEHHDHVARRGTELRRASSAAAR